MINYTKISHNSRKSHCGCDKCFESMNRHIDNGNKNNDDVKYVNTLGIHYNDKHIPHGISQGKPRGSNEIMPEPKA